MLLATILFLLCCLCGRPAPRFLNKEKAYEKNNVDSVMRFSSFSGFAGETGKGSGRGKHHHENAENHPRLREQAGHRHYLRYEQV
jgi:hypothetical protein